MIQKRRVLSVTPARGGSKGIKRKNLVKLKGKSLIEYTADVIAQLEFIDRAIVSTDDKEIAKISKRSGLEVPFFRPAKISGDFISDIDVLTHALEWVEENDGFIYDVILMLQVTSPFRTPTHVRDTVNKLISGEFDSVITVSQTDSKSHPLKQLVVDEDRLSYYDEKGKTIVARQQLKPVFHRNGAAYALTRECVLEQRSIIGDCSSAVVIDDTLVNIDTYEDIEYSRFKIDQKV